MSIPIWLKDTNPSTIIPMKTMAVVMGRLTPISGSIIVRSPQRAFIHERLFSVIFLYARSYKVLMRTGLLLCLIFVRKRLAKSG